MQFQWSASAKDFIPQKYLDLPYFGKLYGTLSLNVEELAQFCETTNQRTMEQIALWNPEYCDYDVKEELCKYYKLFYGRELTENQYASLTQYAFCQ